ncbi:CMD domain-containing protein [Burkholderia semiarida]|uniref:CMD domain-containing protein n=1 Tax=Burkholderia semiarida TaxID=2843303 RepID=A0ABW7L9S0_9BURK
MTDSITPAAGPDTIDAAAGLRAGDAVAALRRARDKVLLHTQLSEAALFDAALPDLSLIERLHAARYVARQSNAHALADIYRARLLDAGGTPDDIEHADADAFDALPRRLGAILLHAKRLTHAPVDARASDLDTLKSAGLTTPAIVALSQLVAFVAYQLRVAAAARALQARVAKEAA